MDPNLMIKDLMTAGYTQQQIARELGVTQPYVSQVLNCKLAPAPASYSQLRLREMHHKATRAAVKILEQREAEVRHLEAYVDSLRLQQALKVL